jgi:NAD(P)-dependent dehydrogenase (short-subunit alcohol dehydrogenase family)
MGANVDAVVTDLSTVEGVDRLAESIEADGRSVDLLLANAGRGWARASSTRTSQRLAGSSIRTSSVRSI